MVTARAVRDGGARCGSGSLRGMRGGALACGDERGKQLQPQHLACVGVFPVVTQWWEKMPTFPFPYPYPFSFSIPIIRTWD
uniref:Uncharacterized protein n=1 Tax=Setaria viridis TaxID=4556 RepID=A0A4U6UH58_SETVI|nr:hypothetical protein SEVIR_5G184901v2 [Setaria viridis]